MDPKGKGMVVNDKEKESFVNDPKDEKPTNSGSGHKRKDGRKKKTRRIKEIVYYDSDESSSSQKDDDNDYEKKKTVNSNFSFDYSRIPQSSNAHLLSIPLGKPPHFDGEDYGFWSHKMRSHLFSLHPSIWELVENGMHFDSMDSPMFINEQIHKNAQATTVLLASLCRDEYHKVSVLDNAKQIWDTLKISHEGNKREKKKAYKKAKDETHLGKEWDSDCSSSDSDNEGLATTAFNKSALFPNEHHTCLMAREKKVSTRDTSTYASSSDEESSDDEIDYSCLFKGLDRTKVDKINELIDALNDKNRLLEKQEDLLYEEHDKFVEAQKSLALEIKRNEMLSCELSTCHDSISSLKSINDDLNAKLEIASKTNSREEHVMICNRCKDFNVDACSEHLVCISKLNDEVASLNAQLKTSKNDFDKLKFARDAYTVGRHPSTKDGLGFKREAKNLISHKAPISIKEKGKAPMENSIQKNHASLYHDRRYSRNVHHDRS
uniref:Opie2 gag protein n=1 Tax=Zea mays TaxID=4577 RepID=Q94EV5_MAIZE|nr:Opie2 gag protein [Zea mays]ACA21848.1 Opie2 gag protein [Zea mays]